MIRVVKDFWAVAVERHPHEAALIVGGAYLDLLIWVWRS